MPEVRDETKILLVGSNYKAYFPSLNKMNITHWTDKKKLKKALGLIFLAKVQNKKKRTNRVVVEYNRNSVNLMDIDNFYASLKYALDALKKLGLIQDDSREFMELKAVQTKVDKFKDEKIELIIYDYESGEN